MKIDFPPGFGPIENCAISPLGQILTWKDVEFHLFDPKSLTWSQAPALDDVVGGQESATANDPADQTAPAPKVRFSGWVGDRVIAIFQDRCGVWQPGEGRWSWARPGYGHGSEESQREFELEYHVWSRVARAYTAGDWIFVEKFLGSPPWTASRVIDSYQMVGDRLEGRGTLPLTSRGQIPFAAWIADGVPVVVLGDRIVRPATDPIVLTRHGDWSFKIYGEEEIDIGRTVVSGSRVAIPSQSGRSRLFDSKKLQVELVPLADLRLGRGLWESWLAQDRGQGRRRLWVGIRALVLGIGPIVGATRTAGGDRRNQEMIVVGRHGVAKLVEEDAPQSIKWPEAIKDDSYHLVRFGSWLLWAWGADRCPAFCAGLVRSPKDPRILDGLGTFGCPRVTDLLDTISSADFGVVEPVIPELANALARLADPATIESLISRSWNRDSRILRLGLELMNAVPRTGETPPQVESSQIDEAVAMLGSSDPEIRTASAKAVAKWRPEAIGLELLHDPLVEIRLVSISAFEERAAGDPSLIEDLERLAEIEPVREVRFKAMQSIWNCEQPPSSQRAVISTVADTNLWHFPGLRDMDLEGFSIQDPELSELLALTVLLFMIDRLEAGDELWSTLALTCVDPSWLNEEEEKASDSRISHLVVLLAHFVDDRIPSTNFEGRTFGGDEDLSYLLSHPQIGSDFPVGISSWHEISEDSLLSVAVDFSARLAAESGNEGRNRISYRSAEMIKLLDVVRARRNRDSKTIDWPANYAGDFEALWDQLRVPKSENGLVVSTLLVCAASAGSERARSELIRRIHGGRTARWPVVQCAIAAAIPNGVEILDQFLSSSFVPLFRKYELIAGNVLPPWEFTEPAFDGQSRDIVSSKIEEVVSSLQEESVAAVFREVSIDSAMAVEDRIDAANRLAQIGHD